MAKIQNIDEYDWHKTLYLRICGVTNFESELKISKFKMDKNAKNASIAVKFGT